MHVGWLALIYSLGQQLVGNVLFHIFSKFSLPTWAQQTSGLSKNILINKASFTSCRTSWYVVCSLFLHWSSFSCQCNHSYLEIIVKLAPVQRWRSEHKQRTPDVRGFTPSSLPSSHLSVENLTSHPYSRRRCRCHPFLSTFPSIHLPHQSKAASLHNGFDAAIDRAYRVAIQLGQNLPLTLIWKLRFSIRTLY